MATRTAVGLSDFWTGTLGAYELDVAGSFQNVSITAVGGRAYLTRTASFTYDKMTDTIGSTNSSAEVIAAIRSWINTVPPNANPGFLWYGDVFVSGAMAAGGMREETYYCNGRYPVIIGMPPPIYIFLGQTYIEVDATISASGIYAGTSIINASYDDRTSPKDYTDRTFNPAWYVDEDSTFTVTCGSNSSSNATGLNVGLLDIGAQNIGSNFSAAWSLNLNRAPAVDTIYAAIKSPQAGSSDINLGALDLHNPGTGDQPPDAVTPGWYYDPPTNGGYWHVFNSGGIAIERKTAATTSGINWTGYTSMPYLCELVFDDGAFNDNPENSLAIDYDCGAVEWDGSNYITHYFTGGEEWNEFHSDWDPPGWRRWNSERVVAPMEKNEWRAIYGENVGGGVAAQNDARAGMKVYPIDATNWNSAALGNFVWPMISVSLESNIDINDPEDAPSRPSDWAAVSGCSVSGDTWTVTASASSPKVKRVLKTRYWLRLNNLQGYSADPELPRDFNWPIMMRPNINLTNGEDGTTIETAVPYEDEFHWNQYAYLLLGLTAAKTGTVTMQVKYSTVSVYDPCYAGVGYRAAEWEYTRSMHTATYNIDVSAGANSIQVDLCCPTEGGIPELWHVDEIWFTLPDGGASTEEYTLTGLALTKDTVNSNTLRFRAVRCWQWANNLGFGIGAIHDGKHVLTIGDAYGYSAHRNEKCLSYIQYAQNNPESTSEVDPSTAKSLARMCNEIGWLRGWNVTYDIDNADPNVKNEDEDGNVQSSAFYSWDLWEAHENSATQQYGATTVGYWELLAGTRNKIHVEKFPRGRIQGIAKTTDGTARAANQTGEVYITGIKAGSQILSEAVNTDAHGWFRSSPLKELDCSYAVGSIGGLTAVNREYTDVIATIPAGVDFIRLDGRYGDIIWRIYESGGTVFADRWEAAGAYSWASFGKPFTATDAYPDIALQLDGGVLACATVSGDTQFKILRNLDNEWEAVSTATIGDGLINGGICHDNGMTWFAGCADTSGDGTIYASGSSSADLVAEALNVAAETSLTVCTYTGGTPVCDIHVCPETRHLIVTVADATGSKFYRCSNLDDGFSQVT